jgi:A/G-specific adenine glycosylase
MLMTSRTAATDASFSEAKPSFLSETREALAAWFRPRRHAYAWRRGLDRDPWAVLVSEVMLQQTQAARVEPIFETFLASFSRPAVLAAAAPGEVVRAWAGLGYHRRATALHSAARVIVDEHGGRVPSDPATLQRLPGVGPYTAAAVAALAYGSPIAAVDTNVRRIVARVGLGLEPDEIGAGALGAEAQVWLDRRDPGGWNEAMMDLGRERCRPVPRCDGCPLRTWCRFAASDRVGRGSARRQPTFEGSMRQARGLVLAALRAGTASRSFPQLTQRTGIGAVRVSAAVDALLADGLVERTRAGRVRLPR